MRTLLFALFIMTIFSNAEAVELVAHRGASFDAPENTLTAFRLGIHQNADALEADFHLTVDGQVVCIHDATTKRTAERELKISTTPLAELRLLDVGIWQDLRFKGERIPTLSEVLAIVPEGKKVLLEIKCGTEIVPEFKRVIEASSLKPKQIRIISFKSEVIAAVKQAMPAIKAYWLTSYKKDETTGAWKPTPDEVMKTLKEANADGLDSNANLEVLTPDFVKRLRDAGLEFHAWTVDEPEVARALIKLGVDSITTNKPGWLREQLEIADR